MKADGTKYKIYTIWHKYDIDKYLIMRGHEMNINKRLEKWCPMRTSTKNNFNQLKHKARKKDISQLDSHFWRGEEGRYHQLFVV